MEHASAIELAAAIRRKDLSPSEALEASLDAIERYDAVLNAIIWLDEDDARARARAADDRIANEPSDDLPPFLGVPIPVKDLYDVEGWPNTLGSEGASADPRPETALPVQRMVDAGFVLCGRSNSPEFGSITATENERYGVTRNPWDTDRSPGGSSGGASAAVASGIFTIAHASDGGGSIRIPSTCTGLVGLKSARGRVTDRVFSWEGASIQGVVTRTVADTAAALDIMGPFDPLSWYNAPPPDRPFADEVGRDPGRLRIASTTQAAMSVPTDPECVAAVERTVTALAEAGHEIVDAAFDARIEEFATYFGDVVGAGLSANPVDWDRVQRNNRATYDNAQATSSLEYAAAVNALQRWTRAVNAQWGRDFDLLVTPTMVIQPPPAGQILEEIRSAPDQLSPTVLASILFTSMFNLNGLPAISLPVHQATDTGLPIGAQLVGGPFDESGLLRVAAQVEGALPWHDRRPDVSALAR
ncbi:MAG: amidase [Acidimicrobiales bacterium]|nr:amidase [Acidimicrobiales bacterium]